MIANDKALYDLRLTPNPQNMDERLYYAYLRVKENLNTSDIANLIAKRSTIKEADVAGAFTALAQIMRETLSKGKSLTIDGIGTFQIAISSKGVTEPNAIRAEDIKCKGVNYTPDYSLKQTVIQSTKFERLSKQESNRSRPVDDVSTDKILQTYFQQHDIITVEILMGLCHLSHSTAYRLLRMRVNSGLLTYQGKKRLGNYRLVKKTE